MIAGVAGGAALIAMLVFRLDERLDARLDKTALTLDQGADAHEVRSLILGKRSEFGCSDGGELDGPHLRQ